MSNVTVIDRRLLPQDKHLTNRQRFLHRQKAQIKKAIDAAVAGGKVTGKYNDVNVEIHGTSEPGFFHSGGGTDHIVAPGNKWFVRGDRFRRPEDDEGEGEGGGGDEGSGAGTGSGGEDSFSFILSKEEFLDYFFADLALPDLVRKANSQVEVVARQRAGYKPEGNPAQLDLRRSATNALGRRLALRRPSQAKIDELEGELAVASYNGDEEEEKRLIQLLEEAKRKTKAVAWIDPVDVRYRQYVDVTVPKEKVVLFCLMDVSGSMGEREKDIAKRYFMLLLFLLERNYGDVEVVFVRHHSTAEECSEEDFFYKRESGGTVVSSGLELIDKIIKARFDPDQYNIYIAQASDGDNWGDDNKIVKDILETKLLPICQYFTYIDIPYDISRFANSALWPLYKDLDATHKNLAARQVGTREHIWPVFTELFKKEKSK
jgi:uncharacterized sporulation protein YeaH/YhbH (DUF444 family)